MPHYRRHYEGRMFFFTLVTYQRRRLFGRPHARALLRGAIGRTRKQRPWRTEAIVLLPDHLHTLWLLPAEDTDYSSRIAALKKRFTRA